MNVDDILNAARTATDLAEPDEDSWREGLEILLRDHAKSNTLTFKSSFTFTAQQR